MLVQLSKDPMRLFDDIWSGAQQPSAPAFKVDISEDVAGFHIEGFQRRLGSTGAPYDVMHDGPISVNFSLDLTVAKRPTSSRKMIATTRYKYKRSDLIQTRPFTVPPTVS